MMKRGQDNVMNRRLFSRQKEVAARNKVREQGGIAPMKSGPAGILASSPELMQAAYNASNPMTATPQKTTGQGKVMPVQASPITGTNPLQPPAPTPAPGGIGSTPQAQDQRQKLNINVKQQGAKPPIKMQAGGDLGMHMMGQQMGVNARGQGLPQQSGPEVDPMKAQFMQGQSMVGAPTDIMKVPAPTPISLLESSGFSEADIRADKNLIRLAEEMNKDPATKSKLDNLTKTLIDPNADEKKQTEAVADAFGVEPNKEGLKKVDDYLSPDRKGKGGNKINTLLKAITQNAVGGAIGGERSVAARLSKAIGKGLDKALEVELEREKAVNEMMKAALGNRPELYGDKPVQRKSKELDFEYYEYQPTKAGVDAGKEAVVGLDRTLIAVYNNKRDSIDSNLESIEEAMGLLETGGVSGFDGVLNRTRDALRGVPGASMFLGEGLTNATKYDQVLRVLAAQLAPELLGESGRTISDGDRARVAEMLGFAVTPLGNNQYSIGQFVGRGFKDEKELLNQMKKIDELLRGKAKKVDEEFYSIAERMPGIDVQRPEEQTEQTEQSNPNLIKLTQEEIDKLTKDKNK
jgi:hypothetical protein